MEQINREFKAVIQDMTHIYIGAQMSVSEIISFDDVPFKVKAVFNKFYGKNELKDKKIGELLGETNSEDFTYEVLKQLRLKFKVGVYQQKKDKKKYISKTVGVDEFIKLHNSDEEYFDEEIVFNKLALLAFST